MAQKLRDGVNGQDTFTLKRHDSPAWSVAFSPDGQRLASPGFDQTVKVLGAMSGQETLTLKGHTNGVTCVAFSPNGKQLASAGDQTLRLWDVQPRPEASTPDAKTR